MVVIIIIIIIIIKGIYIAQIRKGHKCVVEWWLMMVQIDEGEGAAAAISQLQLDNVS